MVMILHKVCSMHSWEIHLNGFQTFDPETQEFIDTNQHVEHEFTNDQHKYQGINRDMFNEDDTVSE